VDVGLGAPAIVATVAAAPAWVGLRVLIAIVEGAARLPLASITLEPPLGTVASAMVAGLVLVTLVLRRRRAARSPTHGQNGAASSAIVANQSDPVRRRGPRTSGRPRLIRVATLTMIVSLAVAGGVVAARPAGVARVTVLDVGQGDAILVEGGAGGRLLVDGGPDPDRLLVALDRHLPPWDRRIDAIILSHPHEDHVAGLALLLDRYRVTRVFEPGMRGPGPGYAAWAERLARPGAPIRQGLATGDRLGVDDIALRVLWPDRGTVPAEPPDTGTGINNVSIVLFGEVGGRSFLLTGDIEDGIDPVLLTRRLPRVDLLKVAHHGSRTATTEAFVDAVRPGVAIASAGTGNPYGHPTRQTLDRLRSSGARVYRTDVDGTVTVTFEASGLSIRRQPRPARGAAPPAPTDATATTRAAPVPASRPFTCAVPAVAGVSGTPVRSGSDAGGAVERTPDTAWLAAASYMPESRPSDRLDDRVRYHRRDDGPHARRGCGAAPLPRSPTLGARARARRGRDRRLAGEAGDAERPPRGSCGGGGSRTPPRCRQGIAARRPVAHAPPR
jgi:competence protein ComEC